MLQITNVEINQLRSEIPDDQVYADTLDLLQECEGYMEDAISILMIREMGVEPDRSPNKLLQKCRQIICEKEFREELGSGLIVAVVEILSSSYGIPPGVGTAIGIYVYKLGIKKFCESQI